jgi:glycosyltransferase involved in cell wall biosynthesis
MGLDNLLKGIFLVKKSDVPIHLIIGGEGQEKEKLWRFIQEFDIENEVTLTGFIPPDKLPHYYSAADFFIIPTRDLEGFGLVTPESMACGTPVIGTPVGGTKEILEKFDSQFLFDDTTPEAMAQGIKKIIIEYFYNEEKYIRLRTRCREFVVQNYSWQRHIDQLSSIIDELIECNDLKN